MELVSVCAWCPPPAERPEVKQATHGICEGCLQLHFPDEAPEILRKLNAQRAIDLDNPLLVPQTF